MSKSRCLSCKNRVSCYETSNSFGVARGRGGRGLLILFYMYLGPRSLNLSFFSIMSIRKKDIEHVHALNQIVDHLPSEAPLQNQSQPARKQCALN